jgi:hypothetical protein
LTSAQELAQHTTYLMIRHGRLLSNGSIRNRLSVGDIQLVQLQVGTLGENGHSHLSRQCPACSMADPHLTLLSARCGLEVV